MEEIALYLSYGNFALTFFALMSACASLVMAIKTPVKKGFGLTCVILLIVSAAALSVVSYLYLLKTITQDMFYLVFAVSGAYVLFSYINAIYVLKMGSFDCKKACTASAIFYIIPPIGAIFHFIAAKNYSGAGKICEGLVQGDAVTFTAINAYRRALGKPKFVAQATPDLPPMEEKIVHSRYKQLKKVAKDPEQLYNLGEFVRAYMPDNLRDALNAYEKSAHADNPKAYVRLGNFYENGICVRRDEKRAEKFYRAALNRGYEQAEIHLGILYAKANKGKDAIALFDQCAYNSDSYGLYNLGVCMEKGVGCEPNISKAVNYYMRAAERNCEEAQRRLFVLLSEYAFVEFTSSLRSSDVIKLREWAEQTSHNAFRCVSSGILYLAESRIADASTAFLLAVRCRGKWESCSRTLLGSLYVDCGETQKDKLNGVAYIKSAVDLDDAVAADIYDAAVIAGTFDEKQTKKLQERAALRRKKNSAKPIKAEEENTKVKKKKTKSIQPEDIIDGKKNIEIPETDIPNNNE